MPTLIVAILVLLACGILIWAVREIPGLPAPIPSVITVLILVVAAVYILNIAGVVAL